MLYKLPTIIRTYVNLPNRSSTKGWHPVLCKVCGDHGKKGARGGFRFDDSVTEYHCFNCGHYAKHDEETMPVFDRNMLKVFDAFVIPKVDTDQVLLNHLTSEFTIRKKVETEQKLSYEPQGLILPTYFQRLESDSESEIAQACIEYMESRGIDVTKTELYYSDEYEVKYSQKWFGRVIFPIYKNGKVIFYQGRDVSGTRLKKYETPSIEKENVLYGFDEIQKNMYASEPIYVTEGWFDAYKLKGVAVFGNTITEGQRYWLNQTPRQKVIIPDRMGDGMKLGKAALRNGWSVATPDIGQCKDVDEAIDLYGMLYVLDSIRSNTASGYEAEIKLQLYCE